MSGCGVGEISLGVRLIYPDDQIIGTLDVIVDVGAVRLAVDRICQNAKRLISLEITTHCHVQLALKIDQHCPSLALLILNTPLARLTVDLNGWAIAFVCEQPNVSVVYV